MFVVASPESRARTSTRSAGRRGGRTPDPPMFAYTLVVWCAGDQNFEHHVKKSPCFMYSMKSLPSWTVSECCRCGYHNHPTRQQMLVIKLGNRHISFDVCGTRYECSIRKTEVQKRNPSWRCFYGNLGRNLWTHEEARCDDTPRYADARTSARVRVDTFFSYTITTRLRSVESSLDILFSPGRQLRL